MGKYTRKSTRKLIFTEELMTEIRRRLEGGESKRSIAESIGVNEATLRKRLRIGTIPTSLGRFKPIFSPEMELQLSQYCKELDNTFYGLTIKALRELVFQFAERNSINHRFNRETNMAGKDWVRSFCKRHHLSARIAEKTSLARASGFNEVQVKTFFDNLKKVIEGKQISATRIYNMDESGVLTVPNKMAKVIAPTGKKAVSKIVSSERGQLITAVCCMSAGGKYVPPALIFPRKRKKDELLNGAPAGTLLMTSESGYMNSDLFLEWLDHFKKNENPTPEDPIMLILDNHSSHISLAAINKCREYQILLLSLPPHSSHRLQPLDRGFFGPLKTVYGQECEKWHVSHPGRAITQFQIAELFGNAFSRVASIEKAVSAFRACGIWPYNPDIFSPEDFAPASVTNRPWPVTAEQILDNSSSTDSDEDLPLVYIKQHVNQNGASTSKGENSDPINKSGLASTSKEKILVAPITVPAESCMISTPIKIISQVILKPKCHPVAKISEPPKSKPSTSETTLNKWTSESETHSNALVSSQAVPASTDPTFNNSTSETESRSSFLVSPQAIKPFPKADANIRKVRKSKKSEILTESPYKQELERLKLEKEKAEKAKAVKRKIGGDIGKSQKIVKRETGKKVRETGNKVRCPRCNVLYRDPPDTDWIQCNLCRAWYHEDCTVYAGLGEFICLNCDGDSD